MSSSPSKPDSSLFERLPARPPTPPRDTDTDVEDALRFLREGHQEPSGTIEVTFKPKTRPNTDTPPPKTSTELQQKGSESTKKVDFSPYPTYHSIPQLGQSSSPQSRAQRQTPLSRENKPLKSILKAATDRLPPTPDDTKIALFSPEEPGSFRKMLQSVLRQLSSSSCDDRRDAYLAINNTLKTYDDLPDATAIIDKIGFLQQFLSRDIAWKDESSRLDCNIVTQAFQLVAALLHHQEIAAAFDDDFRAFLVDRCIFVLEQSDVAKAILKIHVHLLALQHFRPHIMTPTRVDKLVNALRGLEERCSGTSIVATRLIAYQRLVDQSPSTMLNRMRDWIEYMLHGLLSSVSEVRSRAIDACSHTAMALGSQAQAAKIMLEVMDKKSEDDQTYGDFFYARLNDMVTNKQTAMHVPRIWIAIMLFFRCKRRSVDKWPRFKTWLLIIQKCLNSSDMEVKHHAHITWNKLVYTVMPDEHTAETLRSMLKVPIVAGLEKRGNDKTTHQQRQIAMDSYCNLLHYGLRPGLSYDDLDKAWDLYVDPVLSHMAQSRSKGQHSVCRIIHGLLKKSNGVWNAEAALEPKNIKPDELPRLEPRWVRSRMSRVLKILEPIIQVGMWSPSDANKAIDICWTSLLQSVSEAGAQEVKTSSELRDAIAQLTNLFRRIWSADQKVERSDTEGTVWISRYQQLLQVAVHNIGSSHFVEDILAKTGEDQIEAAPTPSHRPSKHAGAACSSLVFLFALYYKPRREICAPRLYEQSVVWLLQLLVNKKASAPGILGLLNRCLQFSTRDATDPASVEGASRLWCAVAGYAIETLDTEASSTSHSTDIKGNVLRSALDLVVFGLRYAAFSLACSAKATDLYVATCRAAKCYSGNGGIAVGVMEPMAKLLVDVVDDFSISTALVIGKAILDHGIWPESRQELDGSRKALWLFNFEVPRTPVFDAFQHLYGCLRALLTRAYDQLESTGNDLPQAIPGFLAAMLNFWQKCPSTLLPTALRQIQGGVVDWIEDRQRRIFPIDGAETTLQSALALRFWPDLLRLIKGIPSKDSALLQSIEPLMIAGFSSPSKGIVNNTIQLWNETFGEAETLEYPSQLERVLSARRAEAHIQLPGFSGELDDADLPTFPAFAESQAAPSGLPEFGFMMPLVTSALKKNTPAENIFIKQHLAARGLPSGVKVPRSTTSAGTTPKPRLRHDDSQVDFSSIESPIPASSDEKESQLLTEHQKDVQARQKGDAQMFPELSSSPVPAAVKPNSIAKKLNFSSGPEHVQDREDAVSTPTGLQDGNPMSDDLPSSPTPRATNTVQAESRLIEHSDDEETICDPPSSPPRNEDAGVSLWRTGLDDTTIVKSTFVQGPATEAVPAPCPMSTAIAEEELADSSDLPSDSLLPTVQLQREAAAAAASSSQGRNDLIQSDALLRGIGHDAPHSEADGENAVHHPQTPSRIQDSMIQLEEDTTTRDSETPKSIQGSRKRKRTTETISAARKKSKPSPLKTWFDKLVGGQEENIEEEIVVASSQQRSLDNVATDKSSQYEGEAGPPEEEQSAEHDSLEQPDAQSVTTKRKRGRPRKSESQRSAHSDNSTPQAQKRRALILSSAEHRSTSVIKDTPAPTKKRKSSRLSQDPIGSTDSPRQAVTSIPSSSQGLPAAEDVHGLNGDDEVVITPLKKPENEKSVNHRNRPIAQPKSILSRLRGVLDDCKKMVFGSQEEERQFDDVLFEIRREVHEAGRRQREQ